MFGSPPRFDTYSRIRYYVAREGSGSPSWTATELVMPGDREDQIRLVHSFQSSFWDKAFEVALFEFRRDRKAKSVRPDTPWQELPDGLQPLLHYHLHRFEQSRLIPSERVVRAEFWQGTAPNPAPGSHTPMETPPARLQILHQYFNGPIEIRTRIPQLPQYHSVEREGDISWLLEYYESR